MKENIYELFIGFSFILSDILFIFFCLGEHRFIICPTFAPLF